MTAPDTLKPLDGEPEIPPLMPRAAASSYQPVIAASVLILSLLGVLGFAATHYFGKQDAPPEVAADVASATATRLKFQDPPATTPVAPPGPAIAVAAQTRVPSIEMEAAEQARPIAVQRTAGGQPQKPTVPVGDESPFPATGATAQYTAPDSPSTAGLSGQAQANMRRYQDQLGGMLEQLQGLSKQAAGGGSASGRASSAMSAMVLPGTAQPSSPALFGSMERSATPTVAAGLLGNRSLTLPKGVLFTCSLKTRVISATSGFVACQVQRNVFSDDGKVVLAERGSHLDGEYRVVQVRPGVTRIPVLWTRLRTPNGVTVDLDSPGTGALGESGIGGYVDNRWSERIGAAMLVSLIDDAVKIAATDSNANTGSTTVLLPSTTAAGSKLAEKVLESTINIPPLLYRNQGGIVGVYVARDIDFSTVYALEPR